MVRLFTTGVFSLVISCCAFGQAAITADATGNKGWDRLAQVPKTQEVKINLFTGQVRSGLIQEVGPEGLTLVLGKAVVVQVARKEIASVVRKTRLKGALLGAAIGVGLGAVVGVAAAGSVMDTQRPNGSDRLYSAGGFGVLMGGIGAAIGAAAGAQETLYRADH